jgi:hypothetical protein
MVRWLLPYFLVFYIGFIEHIMLGRGLEEVWSEVYAKTLVTHMISGYAYARSVKAHIPIQTALGILLLKNIPVNNGSIFNEIATLLNDEQSKHVTPDQFRS